MDYGPKGVGRGKCADVTFKIGPVFEGMLFGGIKDTRPDPSVPIEINHIDVETFDCVVNFAYNNNPKITFRNIFPLIFACQRYQIDALYDSCIELLKMNRNNIEYFRFAADQNRFEDESLKIMIEFFMGESAQCLNGDNFCWFFDWAVNQSQLTSSALSSWKSPETLSMRHQTM